VLRVNAEAQEPSGQPFVLQREAHRRPRLSGRSSGGLLDQDPSQERLRRPADRLLTGGEIGDSPHFKTLLDLGPEISPRATLTDKGYDAKANPVARGGYGQFWGMRSGSGLVLGSGDRLASRKRTPRLSEPVGAVQSAPVALG
jgi:hypothetical protein